MTATPAWERVLARVTIAPSGCWVWQGSVNSRGYGLIGVGRGRSMLTHRVAVLASGRDLPSGMVVDHVCHKTEECRDPRLCPHRRCVNPEHLAVVTGAENVRRQWESGLCREGHPLRQRKRQRYCPTCAAAYLRAWKTRERAA